MSAIPNLTQQKPLSNNTPPPTLAAMMRAHFYRAFILSADPPKPQKPGLISRILNRLGRRRWLGASKGLIVLSPDFIESLIDEIRRDNPALARRLERWLSQRTRK